MWLMTAGGGAGITAAAFSASNLLSNRRKRSHFSTVGTSGEEFINVETETELYLDNHQQSSLSPVTITIENPENRDSVN